MEKIYSKIKPELLLHVINRVSEIEGRTEVIEENNFIQCATLRMEKGKTFPPHKHIEKKSKQLHFVYLKIVQRPAIQREGPRWACCNCGGLWH